MTNVLESRQDENLTKESFLRVPVFSNFVASLFLLVIATGPLTAFASDSAKAPANIEQWLPKAIGQKIMLDLRFYCPSVDGLQATKKDCRTPLLQLTPELKSALQQQHIGGVILFSENLKDLPQIKALTAELKSINPELPMFVGVDQENGRVARLPRDKVTAFAGNMPLGAIYAGDKTLGKQLTEQSYRQTGQALMSLGFNVNFAPNVDVNNNAQNPVINIRSFGDNPSRVANLGKYAVNGLQQSISAAIKHFPGHGDTNVDSHTGLPRVIKTKPQVTSTELAPFKKIITEAQPDFVMSAHIQFPELDETKVTTKNGDDILVPATFSRAILTDMLRGEFGFEGLIITDALDMAAISRFFEPEQAIRNAFKAGADIALMPLVIDSPASLNTLDQTLRAIEFMVLSDDIKRDEVYASYQRITAIKRKLAHKKRLPPLSEIEKQSRILAQTIAEQSVYMSSLSNKNKTKMTKTKGPLMTKQQRLFAVMPDSGKCRALLSGLQKQLSSNHLCWDIQQLNDALKSKASKLELQKLMAKYDALLVSSLTPRQANPEMVGVDPDQRRLLKSQTAKTILSNNLALIQMAKLQPMKTAVVSLRAPYDLKYYPSDLDWQFATFSYNVIEETSVNKEAGPSTLMYSSVFDALAKALLGKIKNSAQLPVDIDSV